MGMQLFLNRFTELIEKKKLEKAKKTDTSNGNGNGNGVILEMCFLGRPHLENEGGKNI